MSYDDLYNAGHSAAKFLPGFNEYNLRGADLISGWETYHNKQKQNQVQIDYNEYMKKGNERAYNDWQRLYGSKGLEIQYPELSYPGAITGYDAGISRAYLSNDIAGGDLVSSLPYRGAGLYSIAGRAFRTL